VDGTPLREHSVGLGWSPLEATQVRCA